MYIGIDIGGTKIEGIVFDKGKTIAHEKKLTEHTPHKFINEVKEVIKILKENRKIEGIGICFPGSVDRVKGKVISMPALPAIKNFEVVKPLLKEFGIPVKIENDGNCMAWGEYLWGQGKGTTNFVGMTIGTGVGGGYIIDKSLYIGKGNASEIGHMTIVVDGDQCSCGSKGCLEEYASGRGIMKLAKKLGVKAGTPFEIEMLGRKGDNKSKEIYEQFGKYLGIGIGTIIKNIDPDLIVIGGGLAHADVLFLDTVKKTVKENVWFPHCDIKISKLTSTPAIGAASLFEKVK